MRWRSGRQSRNIEDRRGLRRAIPKSRRGKVAGGGLGAIVIALIAMFLGVDPGLMLGGFDAVTRGGGQQQQPVSPQANDETTRFVSAVLADTEDTWNKIFSENGQRYQEPSLVLFDGQVSSACGHATAATGPFYCPGDQKVYLDTSFFQELSSRFGAPGDFAQAYVIAHEVGHHIQTILGISRQVQQLKRRVSKTEANRVQVMMELQADCLAGVWARHAHEHRNILEEGDIEEALRAANAIGDDRLQKQARGFVVPDSFTHGTSEQRQRWFTRGLQEGSMNACDTFNARVL